MLNASGQRAAGSRQCPGCGAKLEGPLNFCPHCGVSQLGVSSNATMRAERPYEERETHHGHPYFYAFSTMAVFAFVVAAYVHTHRSGQEIAAEAQTAQGTIAGAQHDPVTLAANEPTTEATNPSESNTAPMPSPVAVPTSVPESETLPAKPPHRAALPRTEAAERDTASLKSPRDERTIAMRHTAGMHADVARNLAVARASLDKNNLGSARRSIMSALAEQPGNGEALQMQYELASREQTRDSMLGNARLCASQAQWVCAWHNAGNALTIDASSSEARNLLSRAMAEQSARGEREFDPSLDTQ